MSFSLCLLVSGSMDCSCLGFDHFWSFNCHTDWLDGLIWMNGWLENEAAMNSIRIFPFLLTEPVVKLRSSMLWMPPHRYITCINDNLVFIPCVQRIRSQTVTLLHHCVVLDSYLQNHPRNTAKNGPNLSLCVCIPCSELHTHNFGY